MSIEACADIVERGDPDRFMAAMAAPISARAILLPIYAFNVEVARAPWASQEPMIAEMRLQWWWDALEEIATGATVRSHEVTTPLSGVLDAQGARLLQASIDARRRDAHRETFANLSDVDDYLLKTGGHLMWATARALSAASEYHTYVAQNGTLHGLANYLLAVPRLRALGRTPFPEMSSDVFRNHIAAHLRGANTSRGSKSVRIALLAGWQSRAILQQALRDIDAVDDGRLGLSEARKRWSLLWASLRV